MIAAVTEVSSPEGEEEEWWEVSRRPSAARRISGTDAARACRADTRWMEVGGRWERRIEEHSFRSLSLVCVGTRAWGGGKGTVRNCYAIENF